MRSDDVLATRMRTSSVHEQAKQLEAEALKQLKLYSNVSESLSIPASRPSKKLVSIHGDRFQNNQTTQNYPSNNHSSIYPSRVNSRSVSRSRSPSPADGKASSKSCKSCRRRAKELQAGERKFKRVVKELSELRKERDAARSEAARLKARLKSSDQVHPFIEQLQFLWSDQVYSCMLRLFQN